MQNMQNEIDTKILKSLRFVDIFNFPVSNLSTDRYAFAYVIGWPGLYIFFLLFN